MTVSQENEHLLLRWRDQDCIETDGDGIADVGSVIACEWRADIRHAFDQERVVEDRRASQSGIICEDDQTDQIVRPPFDELRKGFFGRVQA